MKKEEYYDTDYDMDEIEVDPRFVTCEKEMKLVYGVQILYLIVMITVAYTLSKGDPRDYGYILGLPAWWFAVISIAVIFAGIAIYISRFKLTNMSLTDNIETDDVEIEKGGQEDER